MAINGMHGLLYTSEPEKLRAMLRDVFGFQHVDAGDGWLIFAMPPAELGVHPAEGENYESGHRHLISFMCDDINKTIAELRAKGVNVDGEPRDEGYGITVQLKLPGDCEVMLYEPRHPVAIGMNSAQKARRAAAKKVKKAKKAARKAGGTNRRLTGASRRPGRQAKKAGRRR